jgi:hypothetical protein
MEDVPSNEAISQNFQISYKLRAICDQLAQCQTCAEKAKQHLAGQKYLASAQSKRATQFLFNPPIDPVKDLYELLKQESLPPHITPQKHNLSLILQEFEREKANLLGYIDEKDNREIIVGCIGTIGKQFEQLIRLLGESTLSMAPLDLTTNLPQPESTGYTEPVEPPPYSRKGSASMRFDPTLGVRRLYELYQEKSLPPSLGLQLLDARLQQNISKQIFGDNPSNNAEWSEIISGLIQLATEEFRINFNDLCHPQASSPVENPDQT